MNDNKHEEDGLSRLSFLKASAGAAAGAAAIGLPAAAVLSEDEKKGVVTDPSSPTPREPVVAYVRDVERGEVTVLAGTTETTYRDRGLVKRLLDAAPQDSVVNGGGIDVLAP